MRKIEFHDREKEIKDILDILDTEPTLITFIYGCTFKDNKTSITFESACDTEHNE